MPQNIRNKITGKEVEYSQTVNLQVIVGWTAASWLDNISKVVRILFNIRGLLLKGAKVKRIKAIKRALQGSNLEGQASYQTNKALEDNTCVL